MASNATPDTLAVMLVLVSNQQRMMERALSDRTMQLTRQIAHLEDAVRRLTAAWEAGAGNRRETP